MLALIKLTLLVELAFLPGLALTAEYRFLGTLQPEFDTQIQSVAANGTVSLGAQVRHPSFGTGFVTDVEGSGAHARVQVNFDETGSKWLVLAYANLSPA